MARCDDLLEAVEVAISRLALQERRAVWDALHVVRTKLDALRRMVT